MSIQALEQTRDSVLRHGEPGGRELLNLVVLRQVRRGSAVGPRLAFCANIAVDLGASVISVTTFGEVSHALG